MTATWASLEQLIRRAVIDRWCLGEHPPQWWSLRCDDQPVDVAADRWRIRRSTRDELCSRNVDNGLEVSWLVTSGSASDAGPTVKIGLVVRNTGARSMLISEPLSFDWQGPSAADGQVRIDGWAGSQHTADDFAPWGRDISVGQTCSVVSLSGRPSTEALPFFDLDVAGHRIALGIGWTGRWQFSLAREAQQVRISAGIAELCIDLHPGQELVLPTILLALGESADTDAVESLRRRLLRNFKGPRRVIEDAPAVSTVAWGGSSAAVHLANIAHMQQQRLPIDTYWIDAGWYGSGGLWWQNCGDWTPNPNLYPEGFAPIAEAVHRAGKRLALWFEPERVCEGTEWSKRCAPWLLSATDPPPREDTDALWTEHDSCRSIMRHGDRLLNLGDPDATEFLIQELSWRIERWGVDQYRQDFNIAPAAFWGRADPADRPGTTEYAYVCGLYRLWDTLQERFPDLVIDNCASGGRRIDAESMIRAVVHSRSDFIASSRAHQSHGRHLSRIISLQGALTECRPSRDALLSCTGSSLALWWGGTINEPDDVGYCDLADVAEVDWNQVRTTLGQLKNAGRTLVHGQPKSLSINDVSGIHWQLPGRGLVNLYGFDETASPVTRLQLSGLDPSRVYELRDTDRGTPLVRTAEELMGAGVLINGSTDTKMLTYQQLTTECPANDPQ